MCFAKKLKGILADRNMSQSELAKKIGIDRAIISQYIHGKYEPKTDRLVKIAAALNIHPSELSDDYIIKPPVSQTATSSTKDTTPVSCHTASPSYHAVPSAGMVKIPILSTVIAGYPRYAEENIIGYEDISEEQAKTGEYFCLKVTGTSMLPRFEEGDLLIIKVQDYIENGDIGIVLVDGDNATVKVVHESPVGITLLAYNTAVYQPTTYTREQIETLPVKVIGKVVGLRRDF